MNVPRNHHYVPQMYLRRFAAADEKLWVFDGQEKTRFRTRPRDVAAQRDFYQIEDREDPFVAEDALGRLEGHVERILESMIAAHELPTGAAREDLMMFIAVLATRVPLLREKMNEWMSVIADMTVRAATQSREMFEKTKANLIKQGLDLEDVTFDDIVEAQKLKDAGELEFQCDKTWLVKQVFVQAKGIQPTLSERKWSLVQTRGKRSCFISCDRPVVLSPTQGATSDWIGGFGRDDTAVTIPISPVLLLHSVFGEGDGPTYAGPLEVARLNHWTMSNAVRWLYSREARFEYLGMSGILSSDNLIQEDVEPG